MVDWHNQENKSVNGVVFDIKRYALHDGPGIRTTVFLKGCPLSCPWCHNPEGIEERPQLLYYPDRCIECGACRLVCPTCDADVYSADCIECFACVLACPSEARMISGK
ncbi:MAG: 4Fe-4S binding protein, partial [Chloroflexota bacterium]